MNIKDLTQPKPITEPPPGSVMVVSYSKGEANPTQWIADLEQEMLARAGAVTQVTNAVENAAAYEAQAGLARYIRAVQNAEEKAKAPLNALRKKILDLSKSLIARCDEEGNRLGKLVAEFQMAENNRVAAARREHDLTASSLERERDSLLAKAKTLDEQEQIKEQFRDEIANNAPPIEPLRVSGQVIKEDWDIQIFDVALLFRAHPVCCKLTPLLSEIKLLLNAGVKVAGVKAERIVKSGVRLGKEKEAISI